MSTRVRSKIVAETEQYDDLLNQSPQTRALLKNPKGIDTKQLFKKKIKTNDASAASSLTVHLKSKKAANQFARLILSPLTSKTKTITFKGRWDEKNRTVRVHSRLAIEACSFVEELKSGASRKQKNKKWNTNDFFNRTWIDMPPFENEAVSVFHSIKVTFPTLRDKIAFAELVQQPISDKTKSIEYPQSKTAERSGLVWIGRKATSKPQYPVFIVSKGRAQFGPLTALALRKIEVPFYLMVEPKEYDKYRVLCDWAEDVLVLPEGDHGKGPGRARNACWDYAKNVLKTKRHWCLDDNIRAFYRLHENTRIRVGDGTIFRAAEDFIDRYENIPLAGFGYKFFHPASETQYPFKVNTRIYSCLLIDNESPYRWRGRYNEDTILSIDVLKDFKKNPTHHDLNARNADGSFRVSRRERYATVEFVAFLQDKLRTQTQKGGNTAEFYKSEGTAAKSAMLVDAHPDVADFAEKFQREHHKVQYEVFRNNWLIRTEKYKAEMIKRNWKPRNDKNPYGMKLVNESDSE